MKNGMFLVGAAFGLAVCGRGGGVDGVGEGVGRPPAGLMTC